MKTNWPEEMLEEITKVNTLSLVERIFQFLCPWHVVPLTVMFGSLNFICQVWENMYLLVPNSELYSVETI